MISPSRDRNFFLNLINKATTLSHLSQTHAQITLNGLHNDLATVTKLTHKLSDLNSIYQASLLCSKFPKPDLFLYNVLIRGFSQNNFPHKALDLYFGIRKNTTLKPDNFTYAFTVSASSYLSEKVGVLLHGQSIVGGFGSDLFVGSALVDMYFNFSKVGYACKVFDEIPERDTVLLNTVISGLVKNCFFEESLRVFKDMIGCPDLVSYNAMISGFSCNNEIESSVKLFKELLCLRERVNSSTIVGLIPVFSPFGNLDLTWSIHCFCLKSGMVLNPSVSTAVTTVYSRLCEIESARKLFDDSPEKSLASWNAMISGYAQNGQTEMAISLFREMQDLEIHPNPVTVTSILSACAQLGALSRGDECVQQAT
ncbi:pentatricopeptide repeat (PPR) superfamily protein [Actinidia rufa]|uniref:Pentatricopeptide repeat (PPR) superfamily protein n=1 Tax=Actinidia rufa TaxID=165716 RepID=A0A7J0EQL2_9ERIC|nr:pentatricopeptide repeat (PPR) superfamily protein [Actinidia rufa]